MSLFIFIYEYIRNLFYKNTKPELPTNKNYYDYRGRLHRLDGPAKISVNGEQSWWKEGKLHRIGGPAIIDKYGNCSWWKEGKCHRDDGPAVMCVDGHRAWYRNGLLNRLGAPAIFNPSDGYLAWYLDGQQHRVDGPAAIYRHLGYEPEWYICGVRYRNEAEYKEKLRFLRFKYFHKWLEYCDQPGKRFFQLSLEKSYQEINELL